MTTLHRASGLVWDTIRCGTARRRSASTETTVGSGSVASLVNVSVARSSSDKVAPIGLRRAPKQVRSWARVDAAIVALVGMIAERPARSITAGDVAERIGIPIGSLYEYFEDVNSIVDAAVGRMLDRHDEILRALPLSNISSVHEFVDVLFDTYLQLYADEPAFITLRNSTLWNEQHSRWLTDRVEGFLSELTSSVWRRGLLVKSNLFDERLGLVFSAADAMLQRVFRYGPEAPDVLVTDAKVSLRFMADRLATPVE
jgi:AcrR family transcriptional regulator